MSRFFAFDRLKYIIAASAFSVTCFASGCSSNSPTPPNESKSIPLGASAPLARVATPTPKPTPNLHAAPSWSRGQVIKDVPVKKGDKVIALTFDDGPWPDSTRQILQILADQGVKATFYMVGQEVMRRPDIALAVRDAGHDIGNHSWDHPSRPRDAIGQIERTNAEIKKVVGFTPSTFRPPYGLLKNGMARQAMRIGQPVMLWSADSGDWSRPGASRIASRIVNQATPGGVALMHDGGGPRAQTIAALPRIIETLRARGYRFVTVPELLRLRTVAPPAKIKNKSKKKIKNDAL